MLTKSHGLGNDYLVADPGELPCAVTPARVRLLCDRHAGVGSDGLLLLDPTQGPDEPGLRIFNPDGSEAEKSGNGLRIFAKWLFDTHRVSSRQFTIHTPGGAASVQIDEAREGRARILSVGMGRPVFREDVRELAIDGQTLQVVALSVGNPHCVILRQRLDADELRRLGPRVERHPAFPNRTNVQLAQPTSRTTLELLIWERGAGETRASGSSACAAFAACYQLGLVDAQVIARMPGGELIIQMEPDGSLTMRGPVEEIAYVSLSPELIARLQALP